MNGENRVIALIDMDCFYVQVEQRLQPEFLGKPCGVAQYYTWKGGGLIAVNYEARPFGVKRGMRGEQAKELCPDFHVFHVQEVNGKANLTRYRDASADVFRVLNTNFKLVEKASIDEAYLDLTDDVQRLKETRPQLTLDDFPSTHLASVNNKSDDERVETVRQWLKDNREHDERNYDLVLGAYLVEQIRKKIKDETGFFCSAGIARNKILAKLCCGFNKPKKQTVFMQGDIDQIFDKTHVQKIQGLGGKAGERVMELCHVEYFGQLRKYSLDALQTLMGDKEGCWLYHLVRGTETTPVNSRNLYKSISASKNFPGHTRLDTIEKIRTWCHNLSEEVFNRLEKDRAENKRRAKLLTITCTSINHETIARSCPIHEYSIDRFANDAYRVLKQFNKSSTGNTYSPALINLGIGAGKFVDSVNTKSIMDLFSKQSTKNENNPSHESTTTWTQFIDQEEDELENDAPPHELDNSDPDEITTEKPPSPVKPPPVVGDFFKKFQKSEPITKTSSTTDQTKPSSSITSFFSRYSSNEIVDLSSPEKSSDDRYVTCPKCNKPILAWDMSEHEDFHYARELQMEENRNNTISLTTTSAPTMSKSSKSNKRKNEKMTTGNHTLDAFLSKKPKI